MLRLLRRQTLRHLPGQCHSLRNLTDQHPNRVRRFTCNQPPIEAQAAHPYYSTFLHHRVLMAARQPCQDTGMARVPSVSL
jgi:hypothetical protein